MLVAMISDLHWRSLARHDEYTDSFNQLFDKLKTEIKPDIIVCGGDIIHSKTSLISPEVIEKVTWMLRGLADIAPLHMILGNHDGNLANASRQDAISPIVDAINSDRIFLYKRSGNYPLILNGDLFAWFNVFSCFDKDGWPRVHPVDGAINIALYHGSITGCQTDSEWTMPHGEEALDFFKNYQYAFLGDIHKCQFLAHRAHSGPTRDLKPWIGYPGSLIQQNYGEDEEKGFLVWDIRSKDDWDVNFHTLVNKTPFLSIPWMGNVQSTIETVEEIRGEYAFTKGSRIRVLSNQNISQLECRQLYHEIKDKRGCAECVFKIDASKSAMQAIQTGTVLAHKTSLRNNPDTLVALYREYVNAHLSKLTLSEEQLVEGGKLIEQYLKKLVDQDGSDEVARDVEWSVKELEFSNLFRYGENNRIDFENLSGVVGIFGNNRAGKSSLVSALSYGLFNTTEREVGKAVGHYINRSKRSAKCKVRFTANGVNYQVDRTINLKDPKKGQELESAMATTTSLVLNRVDEKGVLVPMGNENDISRPDTDKIIRSLIGTPQDFRLTSYSSQGDINRFIDQGATQRKAILNRFLDLDIFEKLFKFVNDDRALLNAKTGRFSLVGSDTAIKNATTSIDEKKEELSKLEISIQALLVQLTALREWATTNSATYNSIQDIKTKRFKLNNEIASLQVKKTSLIDKQAQTELGLKQTQDHLVFLEDKMSGINLENLLKVQIALNASKVKLQAVMVVLDKETVTLDAQEKSVKKLETVPCGNSFLGCRFIKDSHDDKRKLPVQQECVSKLTQEVANESRQVRDLAAYGVEGKISEYNQLTTQSASLEKQVVQFLADLRVLDIELSSVSTTLEEKLLERAQPEFNLIQEGVLKEIEDAKKGITSKEKTQIELETRKNKLLMDIGNLSGRIEQLVLEKDECTAILSKLQVFDSVVEAFNKNGIPAMVLKTQLPAINDELSKILSGTVDFRVCLETEVSSNSLDMYIEDGSSKRIIELASGMEKMIASLAMRVALINLSSLPHPNMIIIDEGFGVLDEESIVKCLQLLTSLKAWFKLVLVISHIPQIKEVADRMIEVVNEGFESRIEV